MSKKVLDALTAKFSHAIARTESLYGDEIAWAKRDNLVEVAKWLRDDPAMSFDAPVFCTCIDRLDWRPVGVAPSEHYAHDKPRFEVCYQLRSLKHRHRIRLKIAVTETDARVPKACPLLHKAGVTPTPPPAAPRAPRTRARAARARRSRGRSASCA